MDPFLFVPIVEGHGEVAAVPVLIRRIAGSVQPLRAVEVRTPIRRAKSVLLKPGVLEEDVQLAALSLQGRLGCVLIVVDSDGDCPAELGPKLLSRARMARPDVKSLAVVAHHEFEAWFLAAAASIRGRRGISSSLDVPNEPEAIRGAKEYLTRALPPRRRYSETVDQPALAAAFDLESARRAPSFARLYRLVERLLTEAE